MRQNISIWLRLGFRRRQSAQQAIPEPMGAPGPKIPPGGQRGPRGLLAQRCPAPPTPGAAGWPLIAYYTSQMKCPLSFHPTVTWPPSGRCDAIHLAPTCSAMRFLFWLGSPMRCDAMKLPWLQQQCDTTRLTSHNLPHDAMRCNAFAP